MNATVSLLSLRLLMIEVFFFFWASVSCKLLFFSCLLGLISVLSEVLLPCLHIAKNGSLKLMGNFKHADFELHTMVHLLGISWPNLVLRSLVLSSWGGQGPPGKALSSCCLKGKGLAAQGGKTVGGLCFHLVCNRFILWVRHWPKASLFLPSSENKSPIFS